SMKEWSHLGRPHLEYLKKEMERLASLFDDAAKNLRDLAPLLAHSPYEVIVMLIKATDHERSTFFYGLALKENKELTGPKQGTSLDALEAARYPIIHALDHLHDHGDERELELAVNMGHFWELSGRWQEGKEKLGRALSNSSSNSKLKAQGLTWLG